MTLLFCVPKFGCALTPGSYSLTCRASSSSQGIALPTSLLPLGNWGVGSFFFNKGGLFLYLVGMAGIIKSPVRDRKVTYTVLSTQVEEP